MLASAKGYALIVIACLAVSGGKQAHAETEEVLALKTYADFKMGLYNSAFTQFEYLASLGNTQGLLNLAIMLDEGLGCEPDHERATELLNQAADLGHVNANGEPVGAIAMSRAPRSSANVADWTMGAVSPLVHKNKNRSSGEAVFAVSS